MPNNISIPGAVAIAILVVLVLIVIVRNIYVVQQSKAYVVERLGAFHSVWGVGLHLKVPFIERVVKKVSLKEQVADFDPQPVITKDNVTMQIDTVIYFQITDPKLYTYGVEYPMNAIENLTATTLRNIIGELELDQSLTSRDTINAKMRAILDEATDPWGIKVNRVELKNILPPREIQNAMEKQMKAERERRESILQAEGEKASKILVAEGEKQAAILRADAEKQAAILKAEGEAEAIRKVQQLLRQVRPSRQPVGLSQLAEQVHKQQVGQVGDYHFFHFRLHRDSPLSLNFSLARSALRAAAFSLLAAMSLRIEGRSSRCNFLAVNSLNACSMLSASLALKITM